MSYFLLSFSASSQSMVEPPSILKTHIPFPLWFPDRANVGWGTFFKGIGSEAENTTVESMCPRPHTPSYTQDPEVKCEFQCSLVSTVPRMIWTLEL